jgi:hypothetical protein
MTTAVFYPAGTAHGGVDYRAPQRLRILNYAGPTQGNQVRVQVGRTSCGWWTAPIFRRITCGTTVWDDGVVAQQVTGDLVAGLLPSASFSRATTAADTRAGIVRIAITAPESPTLCAPWLQCANVAYDQQGRYRGVLLVAVDTGLPLSFRSTITRHGHTFTFQRVTFSYHRLARIVLPAGRHVRCAAAVSGQWCLARR